MFQRQNNNAEMVVVVSGLPRSGTSMMMKMLEAGGLELLTDHQRTADENNPKGYYEFERVKKLKDGDTGWVVEARGKVVKVITALLEYLPSSETYQIILMRRDMGEILASQRRMLERDGKPDDGVDDATMTELYEKHLAKVFTWISKQDNIQMLEVSYNDILENPEENVHKLNHFLSGGLDTSRMMGVVDRNLYRERSS
jgi:hypothetical protein